MAGPLEEDSMVLAMVLKQSEGMECTSILTCGQEREIGTAQIQGVATLTLLVGSTATTAKGLVMLLVEVLGGDLVAHHP